VITYYLHEHDTFIDSILSMKDRLAFKENSNNDQKFSFKLPNPVGIGTEDKRSEGQTKKKQVKQYNIGRHLYTNRATGFRSDSWLEPRRYETYEYNATDLG